MMKTHLELKSLESEDPFRTTIESLLSQIPFMVLEATDSASTRGESSPELRLSALVDDKRWTLLVDIKRDGQPRNVRNAILQVRHALNGLVPGELSYGIVAAPFISPASARLCREAGVGYVDLAGNAWLSFDHVYIDRQVADNPFKVKREQRTFFTAKSGRVLRVMLTPPIRSWTVTALHEAAGVSLGQVSNVRKMLLDREWAVVDRDGLRLTSPETLAREWQSVYRQPVAERKTLYTLLHGKNLDDAVSRALASAGDGAHAVLASFSAARWIAPYARHGTLFCYADATGESLFENQLALQSVEQGGNVVLYTPSEDDVLTARTEPAPGVWCTGLVQTWLDLSTAGDRGREAADHLFSEMLRQPWKDATAQ